LVGGRNEEIIRTALTAVRANLGACSGRLGSRSLTTKREEGKGKKRVPQGKEGVKYREKTKIRVVPEYYRLSLRN
jgi:hypothetical protein